MRSSCNQRCDVGSIHIETVETKKTENKADEMRLVTILTSLAAMAIQRENVQENSRMGDY